MRSKFARVMSLVILALLGILRVFGQEFRATLTGHVADPSSAAVTGATVTAKSAATNELRTTRTNGTGDYTIPFLPPGRYQLSVEAPGFKTFMRENIILNIDQTATVNVALIVGAVSEQVLVTGEAPLLDAAKADSGGVIDTQRIHEFPLNGRNTYMMATLLAGVSWNGQSASQVPFDSGNIERWSISGSQVRSADYLLDGAPNNSHAMANYYDYVPPPDSVQEFKVQTTPYDAQYGKTGGGIISILSKSGTNQLHGAIYEFARRNALDANSFQNNAKGAARSGHRLDQFGFEVDGPIVLPKLYNGHDKTFFMFNYEDYRETIPNPLTLSVPELDMRNGDFSKLTNSQGQLITIYDPTTGRNVNGNWVRDPFPGNMIPANRINPIAREILKYFPQPNTRSPGQGYSQSNLYIPGGMFPTEQQYYNIGGKIDQNFGKQHFFFRFGDSSGQTKNVANGVLGPGLDGSYPYTKAGRPFILDWVGIISPTLIVNARVSASRFTQGATGAPNEGFDITKLGFSSALASQLQAPFFGSYKMSGYAPLGRFSDLNTTNNWGVQADIFKIKGPHSIKAGVDLRWIQWGNETLGSVLSLSSDQTFTQASYNVADSLSGNSVASWLLGTPNGGSAQINPFTLNLYRYFAPWVQDDWKVTRNLTLNLGFRWDFNVSAHERFNRLNRGFDQAATSPIDAMVDRNAYPGTPTLKGGLLFAGVNGQPPSTNDLDLTALQPRIGFAYQPFSKMVVRGGYGRFYSNPDDSAIQTNGYSITNSLVSSLDSNRTTLPNVINDPFAGPLQQPPGSSLGLSTFAGRSFSFVNTKTRLPYVHEFSFGIQFELPKRSKIDIAYVGSRSRRLDTRDPANEWNLAFRQSCDPLEGGNPNYCDAQVPNPFQGLAPFAGTTFYTAPTIARSQLARPYPQFAALTEVQNNNGAMWYNSLQTTYELHATAAWNLLATYTRSKQIQQYGYSDVQRKILQRSLYLADRPNRFTLASVFQLPFGKGKRWLNGSNPVLSRFVGGWELTSMFIYQSGVPWSLPPNAIYVKNAKVSNIDWSAPVVRGVSPCVAKYNNDNSITLQPFSVAAGCTDYNFLVLPSYAPQLTGNDPGSSPGATAYKAPNIRLHTVPQLDASLNKMIPIAERVRLQFRAEGFNVTNTYMFNIQDFDNNPNNSTFGTITKAAAQNTNNPRYIQLALKLIW